MTLEERVCDEIFKFTVIDSRIRRHIARAIIPLVLEEAAKVAERCGKPVGCGDGGSYIPGTSADAAAAIRALKGGDNATGN